MADLNVENIEPESTREEILANSPARIQADQSAQARDSIRKIVQQIGNARDEGQTSANILQTLKREWGEGRGGLEGIIASARQNTELVQQKYYIAGQEDVLTKGEDPNTVRATWNAVGVNTCASCLARHGITKTVLEWRKIGRPGQGSTRCRYRCRCTLLSVPKAMELYGASSEAELETMAREPIQKRATAIQKETKSRGKDIAKSTFANKLGNFREQGAAPTLSAETTPKALTPDEQFEMIPDDDDIPF